MIGKAVRANALVKERFEKLQELGCIACYLQRDESDWVKLPVEIHHLIVGNRRRGHEFTIPLCRWHHRGITVYNTTVATKLYGPSLAKGSKPFHARYGSDDELLAKVNELINVP